MLTIMSEALQKLVRENQPPPRVLSPEEVKMLFENFSTQDFKYHRIKKALINGNLTISYDHSAPEENTRWADCLVSPIQVVPTFSEFYGPLVIYHYRLVPKKIDRDSPGLTVLSKLQSIWHEKNGATISVELEEPAFLIENAPWLEPTLDKQDDSSGVEYYCLASEAAAIILPYVDRLLSTIPVKTV